MLVRSSRTPISWISSRLLLTTQFFVLLKRYLGPNLPGLLVLGVLLFLGIGLQLINPLVLRRFIDSTQDGLGLAVTAAITFMMVGLAGQVVRGFATYFGTNLAWKATNRLRSELVDQVLRLDPSFHHSHRPGELLERIDGDVTKLTNFFSHFVIELLGGTLLSLGVLVVLWVQDSRLGLAFSAFAAVFVAVHTVGQKMAVPHWRVNRAAAADLSGYLGEQVGGLKDIQTSGSTEHTIRRFYGHVRRVFWSNWKAEAVAEAGWQTSNIVFGLGIAGALAFGVVLFRDGVITIGTVYLLVHYLELLRGPLLRISKEVEDMMKVRVSVERINEILKTEPSIVDGARAPKLNSDTSIEYDHVWFSYQPETWALRDVSLSLEPGSVLGVVGRTGSGKTTLARLLFRMYDPQRGRVALGGTDIADLPVADLRRKLAFVPQEVQLFHGSVRDNIALFDPSMDDGKVCEAINVLGLDAWFENLSHGLDTVVTGEGEQLSAGEAQLLAFTRVFLRDPDIVILDEAASRLDPATEATMSGAIARLLANRTGMIIAHRASTLEFVDKVAVLEDAVLREVGGKDTFMADEDSFYSKMLSADAGGALA